ncbi:efflux transporter outer membrane subunit [Marinobacter daepoensis]|uniref:efflux transporter outer membrane subunit n=1 Tax=Marinobacter daepoensis TaxID=262077 RepID=UPI001C98E2AF|nr:efflux transporter outer membrane subunit [Marinobacter daepoensis]MBY6031625.1 efflux transporter outer membrane subunit [Marinobacter daepoensis]
MKKLLMVAVAIAGLGGCAVGPDYQRPDMDVLAPGYEVGEPATDAESLANVEWFDLFDDPYLEQLIRTALAQNTDLSIALTRVEEARARMGVEKSGYGPEIRGSLNTNVAPGGGGDDATYNAGVGFTWELDVLGKIRRANEAAQASLLATEEGSRAVMSTLVVSVAQTWFALLELDEELRIVERTLVTREQSLALVQSQVEAGVASRAEERQVAAEVAATRTRLPEIRKAIAHAENTLSILLGQSPRHFDDRPEGLPVRNLGNRALALGVPAELLDRRPDVRSAEQQLHAATAKVGVAVANRFPFPTIGLSGFAGRYATDFGDLGSSGNSLNFSGWGPYIDLPIIDWGRAKGNEEAARAATRSALYAYRGAVLQALKEVSDGVYAYDYSAAAIEANQDYLTAVQSSLEVQRSLFSSGVADYLSVLDSERQLLSAELNLARAQLSQLVAYLDIYRALGGGWSDTDLVSVAEAQAPTDD